MFKTWEVDSHCSCLIGPAHGYDLYGWIMIGQGAMGQRWMHGIKATAIVEFIDTTICGALEFSLYGTQADKFWVSSSKSS